MPKQDKIIETMLDILSNTDQEIKSFRLAKMAKIAGIISNEKNTAGQNTIEQNSHGSLSVFDREKTYHVKATTLPVITKFASPRIRVMETLFMI